MRHAKGFLVVSIALATVVGCIAPQTSRGQTTPALSERQISSPPSQTQTTSASSFWDQRVYGAGEAQATGDVNGDGIGDLLLHRRRYSFWVVFGSLGDRNLDVNDLGSHGFLISGVDEKDLYYFGSPAGDVNGDGLADILIGDPEAAVAGRDEPGVAYVVFGKSSTEPVYLADIRAGDPEQGFTILGAYNFTLTGHDLSPAGDVNEDGLDDVVVGAPFGGSTYVVFGKRDAGDVDLLRFEMGTQLGAGYVIHTRQPAYSSGYGVGGVGDINGDGSPDIGVWVIATEYGRGRLYIVFGKSDGVEVDVLRRGDWGFRITSTRDVGYVGGVLRSAGDFNGDGIDDFAVGTYKLRSRRPTIYVLFGRKRFSDVQLPHVGRTAIRIHSPRRKMLFAYSDASGSFNQDRFGDLVFGAPSWGRDDSYIGAIFTVYGAMGTDDVYVGSRSKRVTRLVGCRPRLQLGESVAALADVDGDGRDELVGSTIQGRDLPPRTFVFLSRN